jgi:hypothetical protein
MSGRLAVELGNAYSDSYRHGVQEFGGGAIGPATQPDFIGKHVRGACGQRAKHDLRAYDSVQDFVDGAVSPSGQEQIETAVDSEAAQPSGHVGASGRQQFHVSSRALEAIDSRIEACQSGPLQTTRVRIEDDGYTLE